MENIDLEYHNGCWDILKEYNQQIQIPALGKWEKKMVEKNDGGKERGCEIERYRETEYIEYLSQRMSLFLLRLVL